MAELAARPVATWFTHDGGYEARARTLTARAAAARRTPVIVLYSIPGRDCGSYSAGGAGSEASYRRAVRALARGIGRRRAIVILEPDAIPHSLEGCVPAASRPKRYALLRHAVRTLKARPGVAVYIDAGNAGWIRPPKRLVLPLRRAGVGAADGFALNVSNFYGTARTIRYGRALSRSLGGAHFVIDTGRNGNGPRVASEAAGPNWCNPPGRALGTPPTTRTGQRGVDAYLWVKQPGASDGACRRGAPPAGVWWPEYALELVRNRRR
jgi:endoglucanase